MRIRLALGLLVVALVLPASAGAKRKKTAPPAPVDPLALIAGEAMTTDVGWERLVHLCDRIGHRLSGSPQLDQAIAWALELMREDGLDNVRGEEVLVPTWTRGDASLSLITPRPMDLQLLALGGSIATPEGGLEADVLVVDSLEDLAGRPEPEVTGRIVVYDLPFTSYRETVPIRTRGAVAAAKKGAVASLVRSVGPHSLQTPHTGNQRYEEGTPAIPTAAITIEAAEMLRRLQERGTTPRLRLHLSPSEGDPAPSANVIGEVLGSEHPDEIVVVGCHLDSWDVGQGAQDDGAGCLAAMETVRIIKGLPVRPKRTVRAVLFTNEENGLAGGKAYAKAHGQEPHFAVLESDTGAGTALGFRLDLRTLLDDETTERDEAAWPEAMARLTPLTQALSAFDATSLTPGYAGADIGPMTRLGVPGFGLSQDMTGYWPIHHTEADTIDKIDPVVFRKNVGVFATAAWVLANLEEPIRPQ
ncbi:MAG: M20/M25/M40 family metallo-hydrolase [Deltaproteobacteria bacterium]|nr:M20/M25/M40 family metallo-hydrolase [Deltaproteobacteria bacterium]